MRRLVAILVLAGCAMDESDAGDNSSDTEYIPDDVPSGNCGETDNEPCTTTGGETPTCEATIECDAGTVCAAGFDGDIGSFICRASCIDDFDETRWCIDDEGCCEPGSICRGRGYCMPAGATSMESGDDTGTSESGTSESGTSESGTSDTGGAR